MRASGQDLSDFFGGGGSAPDDLFQHFFGQGGQGRQQPPRDQITRAAGSGFIISKDGLILTNNHVVENAVKIEVSLYDDPETDYQAKIIGRDQLTDSALIQLVDKPNRELTTATFGDSSEIQPGDWVMAIGNPFGYEHTVTVGVISATQRAYQVTDGRQNEMLQTDAAINPGNSGGPLLNIRGEVIGMNTAIISDGRSEGNIGIGFAVPINTVRDLLPQLRTGKVVRGRIGVSVTEVPKDAYADFGLKASAGAVVASVVPGGAAAKAGIEPGDVITEFNGHPIGKSNDLVKMVVGTRPGTTVPMKIVREKQPKTLNITVDELDLAAEQGLSGNNNAQPAPPQEQGSEGFGLTLTDLSPQMARRLQVPSGQTGAVITDVDQSGPSAGILRPGDVIIEVNHRAVANATQASQALQQVQSGHIAQILIWRSGPPAGEVFLTVKKD
jgi:serine protease Do